MRVQACSFLLSSSDVLSYSKVYDACLRLLSAGMAYEHSSDGSSSFVSDHVVSDIDSRIYIYMYSVYKMHLCTWFIFLLFFTLCVLDWPKYRLLFLLLASTAIINE